MHSSRPWHYPWLAVLHGPGLVLKTRTSWRTWNGIRWRWGNHIYFLEVR